MLSQKPSVQAPAPPGSRMRPLMLFLLLAVSMIWACKPEVKPEPGFAPLTDAEIDSLITAMDPTSQGLDSWLELKAPLKRSLAYVSSKPEDQTAVAAYNLEVSWQELETTLKRLLELLPSLDQDPGLLRTQFNWYALNPDSLLTGYYEPLLQASLTPDPDYPHPIYGLPTDLKIADLGEFHPRWQGQRLIYRIVDGQIEPYPDRRAIEKRDVLQKKAEVVAWAKDLVDVFFLQIQGSGRLLLPDGSIRHIGYAGKNGRPYVSLGREMARAGLLETDHLGMRSIRDYLRKHPDLLPEILYTNPSYVFFQLRPGGPYGAMDKELTPMVSLAVDPDILSLGSLLAVHADLPDPEGAGTIDFFGLGLAQDVGGAIQNHHLDLFCGFGAQAGALAGNLKQQAEVYLLLAKN